MSRAGSAVSYPTSPAVGPNLLARVGKEQWLALVVDLLREYEGPELSDDRLQGLIAQRLDVLHAAGIVPRSVPAAWPRVYPNA